jgi:hypothetical protein
MSPKETRKEAFIDGQQRTAGTAFRSTIYPLIPIGYIAILRWVTGEDVFANQRLVAGFSIGLAVAVATRVRTYSL